MKTALISVTDKSGILDFGAALVRQGYRLVSTGGTAKALREAGLAVTEVAELTGFPEILDGRVKTLHPAIHAGVLADLRQVGHAEQLESHGFAPISLVCVNLYAFEQTVASGASVDEVIEAIDIGGPTLLRAAAKNHAHVTVLVDPDDYLALSESESTVELRRKLAAKAFRHVAFYDSMVARYLTQLAGEARETETLTLGYRRVQAFRYGENPHQQGALYRDPFGEAGLSCAEQLWGIELGYNNWNDADAAWELVSDLPAGSCVITKHGNPCGAATGSTQADSFRNARDSDPISAFGGVVAFNSELDAECAQALVEKGNKLDVIIAPGYTPEGLSLIQNRSGWGTDVRVLRAPLAGAEATQTVRSIRGGLLVQDSDEDPRTEWKVVTRNAPSDAEMQALAYLWRIVPHVRSNAIVVGIANRLLGIGAGQMNRVQSVRLALEQAGEGARGAGLASDAFFPFPDSIETAAAAGIRAIIQPGGSKKDADVIAAADRLGLAMVFTGVRHFRH